MRNRVMAMCVLLLIAFLPACDCDLKTGPAGGNSGAPSGVSESPLFPEIEPYDSGTLPVGGGHEIYYEQVGNPEGIPVMVLHGGPGVGVYPALRRYFDPARFRVVLHAQRGCRRSTPFGEIQDNTTWDLVDDIEALRTHLDLGKVALFGGSWGSTLALAYAEKHPEIVTSMILRGVFLGTEKGIDYHYHGARQFFPAWHAALVEALPDKTRGPDPDYLFELASGSDVELAVRVVDALYFYESMMGRLEASEEGVRSFLASFPDEAKLALSRIDLHYVRNRYFLEEGQLLRDAHKLKGIPLTIVNGRYDLLCPPADAYDLHKAVPASKLVIVERAGHSESEPGITAALVEAAAGL